MKRKHIALVLALVMLMVAAVSGTMAYLTDTEAATNVFTVGSVDIQLLESQYYTNVEPKTDDEIRSSAEDYKDYLEAAGKNVVPKRVFRKAIYVDNTGENGAFVRVRMFVTRNQFESFYFYDNTTAMEQGKIVKNIVAHYADGTTKDYSGDIDKTNGKMDWTNVKADANWTKLEYIYTHTAVLAAGDLTDISPVMQFMVKDNLDNEDFEDFTADDLKIEVYADAIQNEGFENAVDAFAQFETQEVGDKVENSNVADKSDTVGFEGEYGAKDVE